MPSFDVVSKVDHSEIKNALNQAQKEVSQRFDFKGTDSALEQKDSVLSVTANSEERARAAWDVLVEKLVRRKVSLKHFDVGDPQKTAKGGAKILITIKEGIDKEPASQIVKLIKDKKLKVQAAIQGDTVRVTGKKRDDLQEVIAVLKSADLNLELQYVNFRD
ncbi:MAG: YajQ family cyclic di-GMP-binding protein [Polyangiaceae bacterium]